MSTRIRVILLSVLLIIAVGGTCLAGSATIQAFHSWQQQEKQFKVGDVRLISYWMTIPHIAHIYHVPESYLYRSLNLKKETTTLHSKTLARIAIEKHESVDEIIHKTQAAVESYRKLHAANPHVLLSMVPAYGTIPSSMMLKRRQSSLVVMMGSSAFNPLTPLWYVVRSGRQGW